MTMSTSGKKTGYIVGGVVALALAAYGGMHYIETTVVNETRAAIASAAPKHKLEVGDVRYSLLNNTLVLKNLRGELSESGVTFSGNIEEIIISKPNADLLSPSSKDKDNVPVADSIRMNGISAKDDKDQINLAIATMQTDDIRFDMKRYFALVNENKLSVSMAASLSTMIATNHAENTTMKVNGDLQAVTTIKRATQKGVNRGSTESTSIENITLLTDKQPKVTVERFDMGRTNPLSDKDYRDLESLTAKAEKNLLSNDESRRILEMVFCAPKPLLESFTLTRIAVTDPEFPLSIGAVTYTNPSNTPYTASMGFTGLILPVPLIPELESLSMLGYKTLDLSASIGLSWPSDKVLQASLDLAAKDMGDFRTAVDLETQPSLFFSEALTDLEQGFDKYPPKLVSFSLSIDDKGLLGRSATTAQMTSGLSPEAASALLQTMLKPIFAEYMTPQKSKERIETIMTFVNKPGKLTLKIAPQKPLEPKEFSALTGNEDFIVLEAVPGPKTLKELMAETK